jgi:type I restriction enzyme S subunit
MSAANWNLIKLKYLTALKSGDAIDGEDIKDEGDYPVYGGNGLRGYTSGFTHEGDRILIGRQGALCGNINYASGKFWATEHAIVATPKQDFNTTWLGEALRAMNLNQYAQSAAQPGIAVEVIENLEVLVPPRAKQDQIAKQLSSRLAQVDGLVSAKQRLLELLAEKRRALIANAVTRGLNPDVPMRDSGSAWLGLIPSHWQTENTRWLLKEIDDRSEDGSEELLTVSHLTGVTKRSEKDVNMFLAESNEGYKRCRAGDLVINTLWAWMGAMGITRHDGIVSPAYNVYRPTEAFDPDYLDHLVRTPLFVAEITRYSKGVWSSRMRLYPEGLYEASMPVPPLAEQAQIVQEIVHQIQHIDALSSATKDTVQLLEERRTALIAQAVSGALHNAN